MLKRGIYLVFFVILSYSAAAATLEVGSGKDYSTIQSAYNAAGCGDTILVYDGTYREQITLTQKDCNQESERIFFKVADGNTAVIDGEDIRDYGFYAQGTSSNAPDIHYITVDGFTIKRSALVGISVRYAHEWTIRNCLFQDMKGGGGEGLSEDIKLYVSYNSIIENNVFDTAESGVQYSCVGISYSGSPIVRYNEFKLGNSPDNRNGIKIAARSCDGQVYGNWFHDWNGMGYALVYRNADNLGECNTDALIYSNVFSNCGWAIGSWRSNGYFYYGNTFVNCNQGIYVNPSEHADPGHETEIYNNIFYNVGTAVGFHYDDIDLGENFMDYNHFYGVTRELNDPYNRVTRDHQNENNGPDDTYGDPKFQSTTAPWYRLQSDSPAVDTGTFDFDSNIPASMTVDYDNNPRVQGSTFDKGAFEYSGATPESCSDRGGACCQTGESCSVASQSTYDCSNCCINGQCEAQVYCGDGTCDPDENCSTCPGDCGACPTLTCSEQNGYCCSGMEICNGAEIDASDCSVCCTEPCEQTDIYWSPDTPADLMGTVPEEVILNINIDQIIGIAYLILQLFDGDSTGEGQIFINGNGPLELPIDHANCNWQSCWFNDTVINSSWLVVGNNEIRFTHDATAGYNIEKVGIKIMQMACHPSDKNKDGDIDIDELNVYLFRWKLSSEDVSLKELMETIGLWKNGC